MVANHDEGYRQGRSIPALVHRLRHIRSIQDFRIFQDRHGILRVTPQKPADLESLTHPDAIADGTERAGVAFILISNAKYIFLCWLQVSIFIDHAVCTNVRLDPDRNRYALGGSHQTAEFS